MCRAWTKVRIEKEGKEKAELSKKVRDRKARKLADQEHRKQTIEKWTKAKGPGFSGVGQQEL
jgi:hypothetical protein